jgi:hypothetical protein
MSEDHPNPRMRRSVDTLIHKLRNMSFLAGHPEAVFEVIDQLMYHYFVTTEQHPGWSYAVHDKSGRYVLSALTTPPYRGGHNPALADELLRERDVLGKVGAADTGADTGGAPVASNAAVNAALRHHEIEDGVKHVIERHRWNVAACACGKHFPSTERWAHHVQIRIWRYLEHVFAVGEETTGEATGGETTAQVSSETS